MIPSEEKKQHRVDQQDARMLSTCPGFCKRKQPLQHTPKRATLG